MTLQYRYVVCRGVPKFNTIPIVIIAGMGVPAGFALGTAMGTGMGTGMRIGTCTHTRTCGCTRPV
jgi:hypothetical protein